MKPSVCIIGAGIGGLTAGAFLAKNGFHVTVLEKATTVGGSAGYYVRRGRRFPTGATVAFGLEENGVWTRLLDELGIQPPIKELHHPMNVILPDRSISIFKEKSRWEREIQTGFSEKANEVLRFWTKLEEIGNDVLGVTKSGVSLPIKRIHDIGNSPNFLLKNPHSAARLARYSTWTVERLLKQYELETYTPLRQFLDAQLIDAVQTDVSEAALLPSSVALTIYRKGSFAIDNGIGQLCEMLAECINQMGGRVYLSSPVQNIQINKKQKTWKIESKKCTESFSYVINNAGISFGPQTSYEKSDFSWGAFRIDAAVEVDIMERLHEKVLPFAFQIVSNNPELSYYCHGPVYVTFHPSKSNEGEEIHSEITMTISVHTEDQSWLQLSKETYRIQKAHLMEVLLEEVEKVIPFRDKLSFAEAGTPVTYKKFIGKSKVGGFPLTVKNAIYKPKSFRSSLPNWYIVGEQAFPGPGTLSSALSGYYASRAIIKEHK